MSLRPLYQALASKLQAVANCEESGNDEWRIRHSEAIESLVKNHLPSGGGFDAGTMLDLFASKPERLVFITSFHHMDEHGFYVGWSDHTVIVTPSLANGINLRVTGRDRRDIKEYIGDSFYEALKTQVEEYGAN